MGVGGPDVRSSRPSVSPSTLKYHYSHRFPTYSVERNARYRSRVLSASGPVASRRAPSARRVGSPARTFAGVRVAAVGPVAGAPVVPGRG